MNMIARPSLLFALALLAGCATSDHRRNVEAHIGGGGGKMLYFDKFANNKPTHVDSVKLDANGDGTLHIPAIVPTPALATIN